MGEDGLHSEEMQAMLYCMAIMRLVNGVVEKTRKKTEVSIGEAADAICLPRMLIDIRHECAHRDLPSLHLVRLSSVKALDWLKSYYWEPQKRAIQFRGDRTSSLKRVIKSALHELAVCLKAKQTCQSSSSSVKAKCGKRCEQLCGRNKFLLLMAGKKRSFKSPGSKKQVTKALKKFMCLYSSFSSEVVSVLLEFLLKALDYSVLIEQPNNSHVIHGTDKFHCRFDDLKPVILKLSNKEPQLLLTLLKEVLDMIEIREAMKHETGEEQLLSKSIAELRQIEQLSYLFGWLVRKLNELKHIHQKSCGAELGSSFIESTLPMKTIVQILHKCLLVSSPRNNQLMASAIGLARVTWDSSLVEKLVKMSSLYQTEPDFNAETSSISSENFFAQQEESICKAAEKLEFLKVHQMKSSDVNITVRDAESKSRWVVAKSWKPCPIGMLPGVLGFSGPLHVLDCNEYRKKVTQSSKNNELNTYYGRNDIDIDIELGARLSERVVQGELNQFSGKREAGCEIEHLNDSHVKRMRNEEGHNSNDQKDASFEGVNGRLMIDGVWKKVSKEEVLAIASAIRIFV